MIVDFMVHQIGLRLLDVLGQLIGHHGKYIELHTLFFQQGEGGSNDLPLPFCWESNGAGHAGAVPSKETPTKKSCFLKKRAQALSTFKPLV